MPLKRKVPGRARASLASGNQQVAPQRSGIERLAATPWIEAAISLIVGLILIFIQKPELAQLTLVLGVALSFTRYAFTKKLEEEMEPLHRLASVMDLQRQLAVDQFRELLRVYLEITEPDFVPVKETLITDVIENLSRLAREKTSGELATSDYYGWLFPKLEEAGSGSRIWAVSMMFEAEWDRSAAEEKFLRLNLEAAAREALVERIFVVPKNDIPNLLQNEAIRAQYEHASEFLKPLVAEREALESHDPQLLKKLEDGFIAFDTRVALVDVLSPDGEIRGYVTMNAADIGRLSRLFESLRVHARPMSHVVQSKPGEPKQLNPPGNDESR